MEVAMHSPRRTEAAALAKHDRGRPGQGHGGAADPAVSTADPAVGAADLTGLSHAMVTATATRATSSPQRRRLGRGWAFGSRGASWNQWDPKIQMEQP